MKSKRLYGKQSILGIVLFSGLGLFSHFLLITIGQLPQDVNYKLNLPLSYLIVIIMFNVIGFTIIRLSRWLNNTSFFFSHRRIRAQLTYSFAAFILFALNYGMLIIAKWIIGTQHPFVFQYSGYRLLFAVWLIEIVVVTLLLANRSAEKSINLEKEASRLQQENDNARYEALQNQLNPHFLFNSLNALVSEIEYNPQNAIRFTRELSEVYRYVLKSQQQRFVPLSSEMTFLESYLFLHRVRLGNCITLDNRMPENIDDIKIAPLSLQLLAENVIKHNTINEECPMTITIVLSDDLRSLFFSNPLHKKLSVPTSGMGLKNLSNRYQLLCNQDIEINHDDIQGAFTVKIPLFYE